MQLVRGAVVIPRTNTGTGDARSPIMRTAALMLLAACGASPPPPSGGPRGLHANEHLQLARHYDDTANESSRWHETRPGDPVAVPWTRSWDPGDYDRLATMHRSKAAELQAGFEAACGDRSGEEVRISPLQRYARGGWNTSTGVVLYLSSAAGPPDRLLADIKCHRAWMMLGTSGMEDCPLDLPGIQLDARGDGDGITVSIVIRDRTMVGELQRRAAHDLETSAVLRTHE